MQSLQLDLSFLDKPGLVMIEGGENMLKSLQNKIDWVLTYQTPQVSKGRGYALAMRTQHLHFAKSGDDMMIWSKVENEQNQ